MRINFNMLFLLAFIACNKEQNTDIPDDNNGNTNTEIGKGSPGIVGTAGVATWDALSTTEKKSCQRMEYPVSTPISRPRSGRRLQSQRISLGILWQWR